MISSTVIALPVFIVLLAVLAFFLLLQFVPLLASGRKDNSTVDSTTPPQRD